MELFIKYEYIPRRGGGHDYLTIATNGYKVRTFVFTRACNLLRRRKVENEILMKIIRVVVSLFLAK